MFELVVNLFACAFIYKFRGLSFQKMFRYLLIFFIYFSLVLPVFAMGKERQSVRKRPPPSGTNVIVRSVEASRSLADWGKLSAESLILACNAMHIVSTGSRDAMARRLFNYHSTLSLTVSANTTSIPVPSVLSVPVSVANSPPSSFNMESFLRTELHAPGNFRLCPSCRQPSQVNQSCPRLLHLFT